MTSIYERALGTDFQKLHPELQQKFALHSAQNKAAISRGVMTEIAGGSALVKPFLKLGEKRKLTFTERGENIPFTLENYAYQDAFGRETVAWIRKFQFQEAVRHFDATMIYSNERGSIVDYLGNIQELAADIWLTVTENGGIHMQSSSLRFIKGKFALPIPDLVAGLAEVTEWYDDEKECFFIEVHVKNPLFGTIFSYSGTFEIEYVDLEEIPSGVKPMRETRIE
ncbi:DUF4166 domain-containing protein [Bacillus taeanensis]|uniref:DUF4166 domain-containing protein n=1 Tax=Bacillus taeanensis TaxID=273032 RepID=A0A366XVY2_9BACI|nr:DUF4166 domain-containing protein [Bacillus taeanensis]RBW68919.1 DUF4166 domain-containing protein [Bacillus taeanensis]